VRRGDGPDLDGAAAQALSAAGLAEDEEAEAAAPRPAAPAGAVDAAGETLSERPADGGAREAGGSDEEGEEGEEGEEEIDAIAGFADERRRRKEFMLAIGAGGAPRLGLGVGGWGAGDARARPPSQQQRPGSCVAQPRASPLRSSPSHLSTRSPTHLTLPPKPPSPPQPPPPPPDALTPEELDDLLDDPAYFHTYTFGDGG
jgi:hypothetical protein